MRNAKWEKLHNWDAGTVTKEPTNKVYGIKTFTCTGCGATKNEAIVLAAASGDINGDGTVTTKDVTTLRRAIAGGYGIEIADTMDLNDDGVVTTKDVTTLRRAIAGGYGIDLSPSRQNYAYVSWLRKTRSYSSVVYADLLFDDGSLSTVPLNIIHASVDDDFNEIPVTSGEFATYTVDENGTYILAKPQQGIVSTTDPRTGTTRITNGDPSIDGIYRADEKTVYLIASYDTDEISKYVGYQAVPTFLAAKGSVKYACDERGVVTVVYGRAKNVPPAEGVMMVCKTGLETLYVMSATNQAYRMAALIDNKPTTIFISPSCYNNLPEGMSLFDGAVVNFDGNCTSFGAIGSNVTKITSFWPYESGVLTVNGTPMAVSRTLPVYLWNAQQKQIQITTIEALYIIDNGYYTVDQSGNISAIYASVAQ